MQVVRILEGDENSFEELKQRQKCTLQRTYSKELIDAEEDNSTNYLNDLNRHMEVVLGHCNESSEEYNSTKHLNDLNRQMEVGLGHTETTSIDHKV